MILILFRSIRPYHSSPPNAFIIFLIIVSSILRTKSFVKSKYKEVSYLVEITPHIDGYYVGGRLGGVISVVLQEIHS